MLYSRLGRNGVQYGLEYIGHVAESCGSGENIDSIEYNISTYLIALHYRMVTVICTR